ncbi:STAS domain-containing protein [Luedemannella flava]|uniref:Anti-sigma factor antagonist n=1 Tax=Luedemannella flava TaxID=349316 RepID=A0ABN2LLD1_9ACTN
MALAVSVGDTESVSVLVVEGELDMTTAPSLLDAASSVAVAGGGGLVLDLGRLAFCDSAGLGVIVKILRAVSGAGGTLAIAQPTPIVRSVLDLTGISEAVLVYPTVAAACAAVG